MILIIITLLYLITRACALSSFAHFLCLFFYLFFFVSHLISFFIFIFIIIFFFLTFCNKYNLVWSPGSTTTSSSSSDINSATCPATIASATQTSPAKSVQVREPPVVAGYRPVKMSSLDVSMPLNSETDVNHFSPSLISEPSVDHKLTISMPSLSTTAQSSTDQQAGLNQLKADTIGSIVTDKEPPKDAKLVYENSTTKYYTLPATSVTEKTVINIPAPKKYDGIGPLNESGVPVSLRTVN